MQSKTLHPAIDGAPVAKTGTAVHADGNRRTWARVCAGLFCIVLVLAGCAKRATIPPPEPVPALTLLKPQQIPRFFDDIALDGLPSAIDQSIAYLKGMPPQQTFSFGSDRYSVDHMIRSLETFRAFIATAPPASAIADFIKKRYRVYRSTGNGGDGTVLFTGYYEPYLRGSLKPSDVYRFPVYAMPEDMVRIDLSEFHPRFSGERIVARIDGRKVIPYYDREEISFEDRLRGKADVIAWVDDRVDLFFLQIQGSGKIFLDNGRVLSVHYRASNGHPYRSIGRLLIDEGKIEKSRMSMQAIRRYLKRHPQQMRQILTYNPSYVFFQVEENGPLGALGVRLTPARSLATDRRIFPDAALAFVKTEKPLIDGHGNIAGWTDLNRFMLNQDTGGAISGAGRADIFWGSGPYAQMAAGHLRHPGRLYFLVLSPENR